VKRVLITGGRGFVGRNLAARLREQRDLEVRQFDRGESPAGVKELVLWAEVVFHLAGVNRPDDPIEFDSVNAGLTGHICELLREGRQAPKIVFSSSIQAGLDNAYGASKAKAEDELRKFAAQTGASVRIYRLKNLFGKWCRPNYNSVTATFCHNIANDLPIEISDPAHQLELSYVDDVVAEFLNEIDGLETDGAPGAAIPSYAIRLGDLAGRIQAFHEMSSTLTLPDFACWFNRALYATYLSYVPAGALCRLLETKSDVRGSLAEFIKQDHFGQVFVSRTNSGVTRGNHYHQTKAEKFFVVRGDGLIRMRPVEGGPVQEYPVTGESFQVIDIPPGFTHSITNVGAGEMVTLFWSSEIFNPDRPDTWYLPVGFEEHRQRTFKDSE